MRTISLGRIAFWLLMTAAFIPFAVVTNLKIGPMYINAEKLSLYLFFGVVCCSYFSVGMRKLGGYLFIYAVLLFVVYIIFGVVFLGARVPSVLRHAEFFLPFLTAVALMASRIKFDRDEFERVLFWIVVFSALVALFFYFVMPDVLQSKIGEFNEEVSDVFGAGRMYWDGSVLSLVAIFIYFNNSHMQKKGGAVIGLVAILGAVLATQNRTLALACVVLVIYYMGIGFKAVFCMLVAGIGLFVFFQYLPDDAKALWSTRFFLDGSAGEFERAFELGRVVLYGQYFESIKENLIFGGGFGFPLSYVFLSSVPVYTSDISFVSFWVPLGLFGVALIFLFWRQVFSGIAALRPDVGRACSGNLMFLFFVCLLVSLNIDVFSRNVFVLAFVALIFNMKPRVTSRSAVF